MEGAFPAIDYLILGHVTQDLTPAGPRPGGTATYAALTARALGLRPGIVTATANGNLPEALAGIPAASRASERSTTFENLYNGPTRTQYVRALADEITLADVPALWRGAGIVHLAPVAQEAAPALAGQFAGSFVGLTPQGWLRQWDETGRVTPAAWPEAEAALRAASAVVISREDVQNDERLMRQWAAWARVLVVTAGAEGATVYAGGRARRFPAPRVSEVDPTGAGDIFAAVYFAALRASGDPWAAAEPALALASASVGRAGLRGVPAPAEAQAALGALRLQ